MAQINKPSDYFNTVLYTANNGTLNVTGVGFQPDWVWIKGRSYTVHSNMYDVVRGVQKDLLSGSTNAETSSGELTSFDSDGFTVVDSATDRANYLTNTHVAWNWYTGATASSNTDGSITSSVSANTTAGFSIVSYTGTGANATVGHGLGVAPSMTIHKRLDSTSGWLVYHKGIGATKYLQLNATDAEATATFAWNDTEPTSSVISMGTAGGNNSSGGNYIAYCFAEKKGYSKFGTYVGNGSTDGTFIYTGFKPAYVLTKSSSDGTKHWVCWDNKRANTYNPQNERILTNTNNVAYESDTRAIDFLSNGFKMRDNGTDSSSANSSGSTQIYMAFAEQPLVGTNNIPSTGR